MKILIKSTILTLLFTFFTTNAAMAATSNVAPSPFLPEAYGIDTISGYSAHITSSKTLPNKDVTFAVQKPNGTNLTIPATSDDTGVAEFELYDYHTKQAGLYTLWAKLEDGEYGKSHTMTVFADEVSKMKSTVETNKLLASSDGIDKIYATVTLTDNNENPIQGHILEVIPSRSEDKVQRISEKTYTNEDGTLIFALSSTENGVSIYSFLDTTSNTVLDYRLEVAYTEGGKGGFIPTAFAAAGEVGTLEFDDLPSSISANADVSFSLSAFDSEGDTVPNYAGTVHFSAEGSNSVYASLPNDYTFDVDLDSGSHTFSGVNSLNFSQEGTYTVVATDLSDFTIRGELEVVVGASSTTPPDGGTPSGSTSDLAITSPTSGTYSDNQLEITGVAPVAVQTVQVFDNDQNIGSTSPDVDQTFTFQPSILETGQHTVFVVGLDSGGTIIETSDEVTFTVDVAAPTVEDIIFSPASNIKTGDVIDIVVVTESSVFQGAVVFNVEIAELEQDPTEPSHYLTSIQAPAEAGVYPIDVILVDELGNEGTYEAIASLEITENGDGAIDGGSETEPMEEEPPVEEEPADEAPSDVFGLKADSSDQKITLSWQPATDDSEVVNYRIYYGLTPTNLNVIVDTIDNTPTWYIPNLQNGNEYFFAVAAMDDTGNESDNKSSITSSIPFSLKATTFVPPEKPQPPVLQQIGPTTKVYGDPGPEALWVLLASFFIAQLYFRFRKKVC
ncbi:fibronectin type III domain-containing protein [Patescibacteria group bacterium]